MIRLIALVLALVALPAAAQTPVTVTGPITVGNCAQFASVTIIKDAGVTCGGGGGGGGIVVGTTTVTGGGVTNGQFLFNNAGVVGASTLGTMSTQNANAVAITGGTITGLGLPVVAADAANKQYVDAVATGLTIHTQVAWATTTVLPNTPTYSNGSSGVGATLTAGANAAIVVDSGSPSGGDRVLVKNQAAAAQNGIYTVTTVGSGSAPWVLTRATDFNTATAGNMAAGAYFFIFEGTTNIGSAWVFVTLPTITIGTTALTFVQFSSGVAGVSFISNSDGSLTISPTTGVVVSSINAAHSNIWTAPQTFTGTNGVVLMNTPSTAQTAQAVFSSAGTVKWQTGLYTDNSYFIFDTAASRFDLTTASNGNMSLMPAGGQISAGATTSPASGIFELDVNGLLRGYNVANNAGVYIGSQASGIGVIQAVNNAANVGLPVQMQPNGGAVTVGSPTGGALGAGTINAQGLYINGVAVGGGGGTVTAGSITTAAGTIGNANSMWSNTGAANIWRFSDRMFVGAAAVVNGGNVPESPSDWLNTLFGSPTQNTQMSVLSTLGLNGIVTGSRASDWPTAGAASNSVGIEAFGVADNTDATAQHEAWGGYFECDKQPGVGAGFGGCLGIEVDVANDTSFITDITPNSPAPGGQTVPLWLTCGGVNTGVSQCSAGLAFVPNTRQMRKGIMFASNTLDGSVGTAGSGVAIEMFTHQSFRWLNSSNGVMAECWGYTSPGGMQCNAPGAGFVVNGPVSATAFNTISDERLKNIGPRIDNALDRLLRINGIYYTWKNPDAYHSASKQIGVGAQTVEKVFPELVSINPNDGTKAVAYEKLVAPIIEALRELKSDNDNLRSQIEQLKRRIAVKSPRVFAQRMR